MSLIEHIEVLFGKDRYYSEEQLTIKLSNNGSHWSVFHLSVLDLLRVIRKSKTAIKRYNKQLPEVIDKLTKLDEDIAKLLEERNKLLKEAANQYNKNEQAISSNVNKDYDYDSDYEDDLPF